MNIVWAVVVLGGMGALLGLLLTLTAKIFAVPSNPVRDAVREVLPGANCGGCGFPGCDGCADAIAAGKAPVNACPVGGSDVAKKVGAILGVEAEESEKRVARVVCQGGTDNCRPVFDYHGIQDCTVACAINDGYKGCKYACLGLGTCERVCPFGAIHVDTARRIAVVDEEKCQSCGKCVAACPKQVLELKPLRQKVDITCRNPGMGKAVTVHCQTGCIACQRCVKACKFEAIHMENNLPVIDYSKCRQCMMCAEVCPTAAMKADFDLRNVAVIDRDTCIGCGMCKRTCQFGAIVGEPRQKHLVNDACTGCGECAKKCPKKCITIKNRTRPRDPQAAVELPKAAPAAKPQLTPEQQAKVQAALAAKAARENAAKAEKAE
ncbi:MAG: RnfABCDGE type electron transport complex subunit B [Clostridia bacterium]|nr:RnfABCDGE type electron transport complex subunit B [Clostridia bacterium]